MKASRYKAATWFMRAVRRAASHWFRMAWASSVMVGKTKVLISVEIGPVGFASMLALVKALMSL